MKNIKVEYGFTFGKQLTHMGSHRKFIIRYIFSIKAYCAHFIIVSNKQGPLVMKLLRYNGNAVLSENFFATNNRIERTEACIVKRYASIWYTQLYKFIFHIQRLIV